MSKFSNIYDIDGNIIHKSGDGPYTVEQTEKLVDDLTKKVQENPDNKIYKIYLNNAESWLYSLYNKMSRKELMDRMSFIQESINNAKEEATNIEKTQLNDINNAINELKTYYENESKDINDEYVDFEEVCDK